MMHNLDQILETFSFLDQWEDKYKFLIELGQSLPELSATDYADSNKVNGCTAQVWMVIEPDSYLFKFRADSDAHIVKGLIALLYAAYNNQPKQDLSQIDIQRIFQTIGLDDHLSPNRRNGFYAMVQKIQSYGTGD